VDCHYLHLQQVFLVNQTKRNENCCNRLNSTHVFLFCRRFNNQILKEQFINTKTDKIIQIDFLKGYSILTIVIYHLGQATHLPSLVAQLIDFGGTGIHTFIFTSGFGLYLSHLKKPLVFPQFLKKRATKIYTPYIIVVILSAILSLLIPIYDNSLYALLGHVFLYKMFDDTIIGSYGYQLWFISTIIQFYLIFPALVQLKKLLTDRFFIATGILITICWALIIYFAGVSEMRVWGSFFLQYVWEFMLGMVCAERFYRNGYGFWKQKKAVLIVIALVGLCLYGLMALRLGPKGRIFNDFPALFGYTALALLIFSLHINWVNRFILFTSKISYPLFLIHILVLRLIQITCEYFLFSFSWAVSIITLLFCYLAAFLLFKIFKQTKLM